MPPSITSNLDSFFCFPMAMTRSLRFAGETDDEFRSRAERAAKYAKLLVESALTNHEIRALIADERQPEWTEAGERANPTVRIRVDGHIYDVHDVPELKKNQTHDIAAVVDRLVIKEAVQIRLADSVESSL